MAKSDDRGIKLLDWLKKKRNNTLTPFSLRNADEWIDWLENQVDLDAKNGLQDFVRWMPGYIIRSKVGGQLAIVEYDYALAFWGHHYTSLSICELDDDGNIIRSWAWAQYDDYELVDSEHTEENITKIAAYHAGKEPPYLLRSELSQMYYGKESYKPAKMEQPKNEGNLNIKTNKSNNRIMELLRAKVKATGEEVLVGKEITEGKFATIDNRVFNEDELEFTENMFGGGAPSNNPRMEDFNPAEYLNRVLELQSDNFWRDQRVEIVKILLRQMDVQPRPNVSSIVNMADEIIQKLKEFKD